MTTRAITGGQLQQRVLDLCAMYGLHVAHFRKARRAPDPKTGDERWTTAVAAGGKGWPDLFIAGQALMWREIKGATETVEPDQRAWLDWLLAAGGDADVWRPCDWDTGRIRRELQALRQPRRD